MKAEVDGRTVRLPDFLIAGAGKSGTTSLYHYLNQHPQVFMPVIKEPHFFAYSGSPPRLAPAARVLHREIIWRFADYVRLFAPARAGQVLGEASTSYLALHERSIKNMKKYVPGWRDLKIIITLRNPVERAFSEYLMRKMFGIETLAFEDAIDKTHSTSQESDFVSRGFYHAGVGAYMENFPHVRVYLFEDLKTDAVGVVKDLFGFLGVDRRKVERRKEKRERREKRKEMRKGERRTAEHLSLKHNPSGDPKSRFLNKLLMTPDIISSRIPLVKLIPLAKRAAVMERLRRSNLRKTEMAEGTRRYLRDLYREDILKLQELIGRDLSAWLE